MIEKGQVLTPYYRIMNKNGGWTWLQTCATIICNAKNAEEQNIICVNYVISGKENGSLVMASCQMEIIKSEEKEPARAIDPKSPKIDISNKEDSESLETKSSQKLNISSSSSCSMKPEENIDSTPTPSATPKPANTRGRKRKLKPEDQKEITKKPTDISPTILPQTQSHLVENTSHLVDYQHHSPDKRSENSVKDLESVISKHLPMPPTHTDFSADSLLKQQSRDHNANQWSNNCPDAHSPVMQPSALYLKANRESVIRATATRPSAFIYSDGSLPTPPNDYDQCGIVGHNYPSYTSNIEYNNAMTPPSSVSPRDPSNRVVPNGYDYNQETILPLKPQPYSASGLHHPNPIDGYNLQHDQSQYFPHHPGFHFYKGSPWYSTPS